MENVNPNFILYLSLVFAVIYLGISIWYIVDSIKKGK